MSDLTDPSSDEDAARKRSESALRAGLQCQRPERRRRTGRRRAGHGLGRRPHAAGGDRRLRARHRRDLRSLRLRRGGRRRAGARHPRRRGGAAHQGRLRRLAGEPEHRWPRPRPTTPKCRWSPTCPTSRGGTTTRSRPTSTPFANWCCRRPRCWSATTARCGAGCCPTGAASARPTARDIAKAAGEFGVPYTLVTGPGAARPVHRQRAGLAAVGARQREVRAARRRVRRRGRHAVGRAGRAARQRHRPGRRHQRGAELHGPLPRRGLPARHGPRAARPPVLGAARRRTTTTMATAPDDFACRRTTRHWLAPRLRALRVASPPTGRPAARWRARRPP